MKRKPRLNELTKAEKIALIKEICRICEKQYRKGYQHGFTHGKERLVTQRQVSDFRLKGQNENYSNVVYPPHFKSKENSIDRILSELSMPNMEILKSLFREVGD